MTNDSSALGRHEVRLQKLRQVCISQPHAATDFRLILLCQDAGRSNLLLMHVSFDVSPNFFDVLRRVWAWRASSFWKERRHQCHPIFSRQLIGGQLTKNVLGNKNYQPAQLSLKGLRVPLPDKLNQRPCQARALVHLYLLYLKRGTHAESNYIMPVDWAGLLGGAAATRQIQSFAVL